MPGRLFGLFCMIYSLFLTFTTHYTDIRRIEIFYSNEAIADFSRWPLNPSNASSLVVKFPCIEEQFGRANFKVKLRYFGSLKTSDNG